MMLDMLKKTLGQRKWFWPLLAAMVLVGFDLGGLKLDQETLVVAVVLVLGSTAGESIKDFIAMLGPVAAAMRRRDTKAVIGELLELKEEIPPEELEKLKDLVSRTASGGTDPPP